MLRSAVVQKLAIIGEAAARVSEELKARQPRCLGLRPSPFVIFLFTPTSASTGTSSGAPPRIAVLSCVSRSL